MCSEEPEGKWKRKIDSINLFLRYVVFILFVLIQVAKSKTLINVHENHKPFFIYYCFVPELWFLFHSVSFSNSEIHGHWNFYIIFYSFILRWFWPLFQHHLLFRTHTHSTLVQMQYEKMGWSNSLYKYCMQTSSSFWTRAQVQWCLKKEEKQIQQQQHIWSFWFFWLTTTQQHTWMHRTRYTTILISSDICTTFKKW